MEYGIEMGHIEVLENRQAQLLIMLSSAIQDIAKEPPVCFIVKVYILKGLKIAPPFYSPVQSHGQTLYDSTSYGILEMRHAICHRPLSRPTTCALLGDTRQFLKKTTEERIVQPITSSQRFGDRIAGGEYLFIVKRAEC